MKMSSNELILNWLNNELKLQPNVIDISKEFSNGYRFAELLNILKEISPKELENIKNSNNYKEIKNNFNIIKNILNHNLNLDIREEEFNSVINNDITAATIILYKIKNAVVKKDINFINIKTFSHEPTKEEINKKVLEIIDNKPYEEMNTDEDLLKTKTKTKNNRYYIKKISGKSIDLKSIESEFNEALDSNKNLNLKEYKRTDNSNKGTILNINMYKKNLIKSNNNKNINNIYSSNTISTINTNKTYDSNKGQLTVNTMETSDSNLIGKNKINLKPFSINFNLNNINNARKMTILPKILPRMNINNDFDFKSSIMNSNIGSISNKSIFSKRINYINAINYHSQEKSIDFNNDYGMLKIKEIKSKMKKALDDIKRNEEMKNELKLKKEYEIKEKYQLDFINKKSNPLYKFTKFTGVNLFMNSNKKNNSCYKRSEYSKELKEKNHKDGINQEISYIKKLMNKNTEIMNLKLKEKYKYINLTFNNNNLEPFNKRNFLKKLNNLNKDEFNLSLIKKHNKEKEIYPLIKNVVYSLIELMEDIYDYQENNEKEIIEVEDFKMFSELFIKDKHKPKIVLDIEDLQIKSLESKEDKIDINNLILNEDEKYLIDDYINYIGIWNDEKIINNELKGYKFDFKELKPDLPSDYEPTENEIEDITLPIKISDNYMLGNTILNIIDTKYSKDINKEIIELNKDSINKENNNLSKWSYIPYKLSLIGYPLSGRKFIAENLITKYPNIKIYSIKKILRDYYIEYKNLTEQIDGNPKYKSLKPNQITQMKEEREKKLKDFEPIVNVIKPFIDFVNGEKIRKKIEEEKLKNEKENLNNFNNNIKGNKNLIKTPKKKGVSPVKKRKNTMEKEEEFVEENINDDLKIIPKDEILFNLLKYEIEKDFPIKSKEELDKEIIDNQTKIFQILKNIENIQKQKKEATKPNPKDDITINNLQKELDNIKLDSIKGFILVDYPCNINQSILLENYLTGYVDETQKPKSEKNKIINNLSKFLDFKILPKKNNIFKKAGIDFIINLINQEKDIDERFKTKKYDPISDKIYTNSDINEENKNKQPLDKKIMERLINDVPYLTKENFDYYKDEYNNNISLINSLYNKFGMYVEVDSPQDNDINILGIDFSEKELKKTFQSIELDTNLNNNLINNLNIKENTINEKTQGSPKKNNEKKRANIKRKSITKKIDNSDNINIFDLEEKNKNKILNFISNNIINWLYKEKDKSDKRIFYSLHPEYNTDEENDRIKFDPELKVNEIKNDKKKNSIKAQSNNASIIMGENRITSLVNKNSEYVIKELINFNHKYYKYIGKFIYLITNQKNSIFKRLNLIQKKFRDFLNQETNKKKVIKVYVKKYNEFFRDKQHFFQSSKVIEEFSEDIKQVNNNLWILTNEKEKESLKELETIKNSGFIEKELEKFYENIKELSLIETERFLIMINSIIYLYTNNPKNINVIKKEENNNNSLKHEKELNEMYYDKNYIIKNLIDINLDQKENTNSFKSTDNRFNKTKTSYKLKKETKNGTIINNLILQISNNIEIIFMNSIKLILEYQEIIEKLIKEIKNASTISHKKNFKKKNTKFNISLNNSSMISVENFTNDKIIKMLQNEKNRYKYRMCYIKSFVYKYITIIIHTTQNIYNNLDEWIITNISLQNDSLNKIISLLKNKLKEHRLINEKKEINTIEMDKFEKQLDENNEGSRSDIGLKPIDNSSVGIGRIYNKINVDYLINDNFIDIKIEEINNQIQMEEKDKKDKNGNMDNKKYKIILPNELDKSINSSINNSFGAGLKNRLREFDFYFDINKFNTIYLNIKKYEIEENIINKDIFYEIFIKQYLIDKYNENEKEKENINLGVNKINPLDKSQKSKNKLNESDEEDGKINSINENLMNNQSNSHNLDAISKALKMLNTKQYNRIYNLYKIHIEDKISNNQVKLDYKEENTKEEKEDSIIKIENNNNKEEKNENNLKDNCNKDKNIEYEIYLNTSEIFTIIPLIGCKIMNLMEEEHILGDLKDKLIREKYLSKKDFMEYNFWFEQDFEYQNEDIIFKKMLEEKNISPIKQNNTDLEPEKINIKEFLFNIWKDDKGEKMNFQQFINVLKINKYITDLNGLNEENYYNLIFKNEIYSK